MSRESSGAYASWKKALLKPFMLPEDPNKEAYIRNVSHTAALSSVASCLVLARSGVMYSDSDIKRMSDDLAALREDWELSPEEMMQALSRNEPELHLEWQLDPS